MSMSHEERRARRQRIADYCRDHTVTEAAFAHGVSCTFVREACAEHGVAVESLANAKTASSYAILLDLHKGEGTQVEIAERHGVSRQRVGQIAAEARKAGWQV